MYFDIIFLCVLFTFQNPYTLSEKQYFFLLLLICNLVVSKLGKVSPVDNRPSTDSLTTLSKKKLHVTCVIWHLTYDLWHVTCETWREVTFLYKIQVSSSYGVVLKVFRRYLNKRMTYLLYQLVIKVLFVEQPRLNPVC